MRKYTESGILSDDCGVGEVKILEYTVWLIWDGANLNQQPLDDCDDEDDDSDGD